MRENCKILVVQIGKIGDMILNTPLFSELKRIFPSCSLDVLASDKNALIPSNSPLINKTYIFRKNLISLIKLILNLKKEKYDLWIDTKADYSKTSKYIKAFANPIKSIGFNTEEKVFDVDLTEFLAGKHYVDINISPIAYLTGKKEIERVNPQITIPKEVSELIFNRIENIKGKKILINFSSGIETRTLGYDKWYELVKKIKPEFNLILTGMKNDYESINKLMHSNVRDNLYFIGTDTILELAELIKLSDLIITPDTSAVHIASCFNKPIVCFYFNVKWNLERFAPLSRKQKVLVSDEENSLNSIKVEQILEAVNYLMH